MDNELSRITQETIAFYENKFATEKFPVPESLVGRKHLVSQYMRVWKFFEGLLDPQSYHDYASIVLCSTDEYEYYKMCEPEVIDRCEIDMELKGCILALIDMELEDLQVEVKKLKNASKLASGGVSVRAVAAVREVKDRVISLVVSNAIKLEGVTETKCQLVQWLNSSPSR